MKTDISRSTFRTSKNYSAVRMQQGRVVLDTDWNEQIDIENNRNRILTVDSLGPVGAPAGDAGFQVSPSGDTLDLLVSPGRFYIDGLLVTNEAEFNVSTQPDLPGVALPAADGNYLAYLKVFERAVTALEDPEIRETALGGPDTTTRTKIMRQVHLTPVAGAAFDSRTIPAEWNAIISRNPGRISARTQADGAPVDPCAVGVRGGYTGLDNLLYRVEIHDGGAAGTATYKWSRDNGALVTEWLEQDGDTLTLRSAGTDNVQSFAPGQWVEIIDDGLELEGLHGTLAQILRVEGRRITINPDNIQHYPGSSGTLDITEFNRGTRKVRRWDMVDVVAPPVVPDGAGGEVWLELENGIEIKFDDLASTRDFRTGDYWMIPARADDNNIQWACDNNGGIEHEPHGVYFSYARLAFVNVAGGVWSTLADAREIFPGLTDEQLAYVGGDGQLSEPGIVLDRPLEVRVTRGATPVPDAKVRFAVTNGTGTLQDSLVGTPATTFDISADVDGIARVYWTLIDAVGGQSVTAVLLDENDQTTALYITFGAGSGVASGIQYTPISTDTSVAGTTNVQEALDALADNKVNRSGDTMTGNLTVNADFEVTGNMTIRGDVIARDATQQGGDVLLGDDDIDRVIIHGTLQSQHTSGALEIEGPVHMSTTDPTKSPLRVDGPSTGGSPRLYRLPLDLDHTNGSATTLNDYQLLITVDTATLISAGRMESDGADILFEDEDGSGLFYWVESGINTATTRIWVRVPVITAAANRTIYMLYGNSNAVSQSSSANTFVREVPNVQIAYELNEGSGTTATDLSGNNIGGTIQGTAAWTAGQYGQALDFDGSSTMVSIANGTHVGNGVTPFTASVWFRAESLPANTNVGAINLTQDTQFILTFWRSNTLPEGLDATFRGSNHHPLPVDMTALLNNWHHYVAVYNGGDKNLATSYEVYLDGVRLDPATANQSAGPAGGVTNDNILGSDGGTGGFFDGQMSDLRVYTRALSAAEVADIHANKGYVTLANPGTELVRRFAAIEPVITPGAEEANPLSETPILFAQETSGNVGIGTDTPGEKLSVDGIIETQTGGIKFPDGTIQTTAGGPGGGGGEPLPLGTIMAWHKDLQNTPPIPEGWVECNGQILSDVQSPYDGLVIPNLNGQKNSWNTKGSFLRGGATSGEFEDDEFQGHRHNRVPGGQNEAFWTPGGIHNAPTGGGFSFNGSGNGTVTGDAVTDGPNDQPRTGPETRPVNMSVVWIMKIKNTGESGLWTPNDEGIHYDQGKVSVGTDVTDEQFTVSGAISLEEKILEPTTTDDFGKIYVRENDLSYITINTEDQSVDMPSLNRPAVGDFTISIWFRIEDTTRTTSDDWILDTREINVEGPDIEAIVEAGTNGEYGLAISYQWADASHAQSFVSMGPIIGQWMHLTLSREGAESRIYVNGHLVKVGADTGTARSEALPWDKPWRVGRRSNDQSAGHRTFPGSLDDLGMWDRALSHDEIAALHNSGRGSDIPTAFASSLVGYWPMTLSLTPNQIDDVSGNDFHGTIQNGITVTPERVGSLYFKDGFGNVTSLAGGGDSYRTGGSGNQVPVGTIMAWHKDEPNTPAIPDGWVECNGQTLDDPASPYHGQLIPDLNGEERFLRGSGTSGTMQNATKVLGIAEIGGANQALIGRIPPGTSVFTEDADEFISTGPGGRYEISGTLDSLAANNRPESYRVRAKNMSVIWIMKVRETDRDRGLWREQGEDIYFDDGKVGIGAKTANASLHVSANDTFDTPLRIDAKVTLQGVQGRLLRSAITLDNTDTVDLVDHQILIVIDTQALVSQGKMRFDGADILFVDTDGKTILPHLIESGMNTVATRIFVRVPAIAAGGSRGIFIQYGKPDATPQVSGAAFSREIPGLVLAYNFEEGSGGTVLDSSGMGRDGNHSGTRVPGYRGEALSFTGGQGVGTNQAHTWGFSTEGTISAWIKTSTSTGGANTIVSILHGAINDEMLFTVLADGTVRIYNHNAASVSVSRASTSSVLTGAWVHVVGILEGGIDGTGYRLYVNGVRDDGPIFTVGSPTPISDATPRTLLVGTRTGANEHFEGEIDMVRVYDRPLSDQEVAEMYANESLTVAHYPGRELLYKTTAVAPTVNFSAEEPNPVSGSPILFAQNLTGNIGIGTDDPLSKLHIAGTAGVDGIMFPDGTVQTSAAFGSGGGGDSTPLGTIIAWHKSLSGTPAIPDGWVECNGQTLSDSESPYDTQVIPDLNNPKNPWNSKGSFLRGDTTSGMFEDDAFQGHRHNLSNNNEVLRGGGGNAVQSGSGSDSYTLSVLDPTSDGANGAPRTTDETRVVNMSVVWIMKVKQSDATGIWQQNGSDTYFDTGDVAIGTNVANAKLTVDGDLSLKEGGPVPNANVGFGKVYAQENTLRHLDFDGVADYVSMPPLGETGVGSFTVACWFRLNDHNPPAASYLVDFRPTGGDGPWLILHDDGNGGTAFNPGVTVSAAGIHHNFNVGDIRSQWHHAAYVREGSVTRSYFDGVLVSDVPSTGSPTSGSFDLNQAWLIGNSSHALSEYLNGSLSQIGVWKRSMAGFEIAAIFASGREVDLMQNHSSLIVGYWPIDSGDSGTTINDHSGNGNHGTLQANTSFGSEIAGSLYYKDGHGTTTALAGAGSFPWSAGSTGREVPLGTIMAWHKSLAGTPAIPEGWVECNGQVLVDIESPYHNLTIPDLNNPKESWNTKGSFLRGDTTSGTFEDDAMQGHRHASPVHMAPIHGLGPLNAAEGGTDPTGDPISDGTNGTPRTDAETRPANMSVVWIMKIKHTGNGVWIDVPQGVSFDDGDVGIGTTAPVSKLTVDGALSLREDIPTPGATLGFGKLYTRSTNLSYLELSGNQDYVSMPALGNASVGDFTVSAWFRLRVPNPTSPTPNDYILDFRGDGTPNKSGPHLVLEHLGNSEMRLVHFLAYPDLQLTGFEDNAGNILGEWHQTVLSRNGSELKQYLDGRLISSDPTFGTAPRNDTIDLNSVWRIGGAFDGGASDPRFWHGSLDDIAVWDRTLTDDEIATIHNAGRGTDLTTHYSGNMLGFWPMDDGATSTTIRDASGNGFDGTLQNSAAIVEDHAGALMFQDGFGNTTSLAGSGGSFGSSGGGREVPLGTIMAWHKSLTGTPAMPAGWVECNGQTLSDVESPYDGEVIPDLNNPKESWNSKGSFLRGDTASGTFENDAFQGHHHTTNASFMITGGGAYNGGFNNDIVGTVGDPIDGNSGTVRVDDETRPTNMSVVWIMKVKHIGNGVWESVSNGVAYTGGRVGIGTSTPTTTLDVSGYVTKQEVAFSVANSATGDFTNPHNSSGSEVALQYAHVGINTGSGFQNDNQTFIAPVDGTYAFSVYFLRDPYGGGGVSNEDIFVTLYHNDVSAGTNDNFGRAWAGESDGNARITGSLTVLRELAAGDSVETRVDSDSGVARRLQVFNWSGWRL